MPTKKKKTKQIKDRIGLDVKELSRQFALQERFIKQAARGAEWMEQQCVHYQKLLDFAKPAGYPTTARDLLDGLKPYAQWSGAGGEEIAKAQASLDATRGITVGLMYHIRRAIQEILLAVKEGDHETQTKMEVESAATKILEFSKNKNNADKDLPQLLPQPPKPEPSSAPVLQMKTPMPFPCPEASWKDITITGREDHGMIYIKNARNGTSGIFSYVQLGMVNKKSKTPNATWYFLYGLIKNNGETVLNSKDNVGARNKASQLEKALKSAFGIKESIWVGKRDKKKNEIKRRSYILKIQTRKGEAFKSPDASDEIEVEFQKAQQKIPYRSLD